MQSTQPQQKAGVATLMTGKYGKRTTTLTQTGPFAPGDSIVFRATIKNASGQPVPNATASIAVTGPTTMTVLTGPSDANGIADGIWKTSAPSRKSTGTPIGDLHGHGQRRDGKRLCLGQRANVRDVHIDEINQLNKSPFSPPLQKGE